MEILLDRKANVNVQDNGGDTPIHGAAWGGDKEIVELLITAGAEVNVKNTDGRTPIDNAAKVGHKEIVKFLREKGAILNRDEEKNANKN